ncbi:hypothetical protein BAJUN_01510 [Bajunvirus bajun]|uniref:SprT-like domain-containing protein n=1 Tax=Brevundimonas phage vB_BgoS-Bajun TaxID=2948594 RepID=A0A9E7STA8_9CAUD|nr:hypothetical protein BAJUN_01510 [Brevundimonas phage vB_BgoS-Bajun]
MSIKERDSQRSKLYKAEGVLRSRAARLETVPDIERFIAKVIARAPIQERYGRWLRTPIKVKDGRGRSNAGGHERYITMPLWSRTDHIVLHELAHTLTRRKHGLDVAGHGWQYAAIYLDLVWFGMGREAHDVLKASFKAGKVRFAEPRKRAPLTDEAKAVLAGRLKTARDARLAA